MKLFLLILVNFIFINKAYSQNIIEIKIEIGAKRKITKVDVEGADTTLEKSIKKRLSSLVFVKKHPKKGKYIVVKKRPPKGKYIVRLAYVIAKDGSIAEVRCLNDPGYGMGQELVRAIRKSPVWAPATQGGRPVRPYSTSY
jgi:hypothetical protein